eukprot:ANDGO_03253.mRNA.1 Kinetochore protein ndc80
MSTIRRTTLGPISGSQANIRASLGPARAAGPKPSLGPRQSILPSAGGLSVPRRSSVFVQANGSTKIKEPRNISDKGFMNQSVKNLAQFLLERGFDATLTAKQLLSPSTKDFLAVLTFMTRQIDPSFAFSENWEDEIMSLFKRFRYPFTFSKRNLMSVGSPHTWPHLLAGLTWMMDLLLSLEAQNAAEKHNALESNQNLFDSEEDGERIFFEYLAKSYAEFLSGVGEVEVLERDLVRIFDIRNSSIEHEVASLTRENEQLDTALHKFKNEVAPITTLDARKKDLIADLAKFTGLNDGLVQHKSQYERKVADREAQSAALDRELQQFTQKKKDIQSRLEEQDAQQIDAAQIGREKRTAVDHHRAAVSQRENLQGAVWEREQKLQSCIQSLEGKISSYDSIKTRLRKYFNSTSRVSLGDDLTGNSLTMDRDDSLEDDADEVGNRSLSSFMGLGLPSHSDVTIDVGQLHSWVQKERDRESLAPQPLASNRLSEFGVSREEGVQMTTASQVLGIDFRNVVKPALRKLRETLQNKVREAQAALREAEDELSRMSEKKTDKAEDVAALEAKMARLESQYKVEKEVLQNNLRSTEEELTSLEAEMQALRRDTMGGLTSSETARGVKEEELKRVLSQTSQEKDALNRSILAILDDLTTHKQFVQEKLSEYRL